MELGFTPASLRLLPASGLFTAPGGPLEKNSGGWELPLSGLKVNFLLVHFMPFTPSSHDVHSSTKRFPRDFRKPFCVEIESVLAASRFQGNTIDHKRKPKGFL